MKPYRLASLIAPAIIAYAMTGCADYPVTGSLVFVDPGSGAKGGLTFVPGQKPTVSVKVPYYNEKGDLVGMLDVGTTPKAATVIPEK